MHPAPAPPTRPPPPLARSAPSVPSPTLALITTCALPRHEFLGPDPRVAGYYVDTDGDYHIKWYDTFLGDQWMDDRKWKFDVRLDESGRWVDADEE